MSTVSKGTSMDLKIWTTVLLNPHRGASLLPFMNTTILLLATNLSMAPFISGPMARGGDREGAMGRGAARARGASTRRPRTAATAVREDASAEAAIVSLSSREKRSVWFRARRSAAARVTRLPSAVLLLRPPSDAGVRIVTLTDQSPADASRPA